MTVQLMKTKAEQALAEAYQGAEASLPGGERLGALRRKAIGSFAALGLPHRRIEEWKYTDLRAVLKEVFPFARPGAATGDGNALVAQLLPGVACEWVLVENGHGVAHSGGFSRTSPYLSQILREPPAWLDGEVHEAAARFADGVQALNTAFFSDGIVLDVADEAVPEKPYVMLFRGSAERSASVLRNVIRVGRGAKAVLVEVHDGPAVQQSNSLTQLVLGDGAEVVHVKLVQSASESLHLGTLQVRIGKGAVYQPFQMTIGSGLVRNDLAIEFRGENSTFDLGAASLVDDRGHVDTTLVVDHKVAHTTSRELVKAVLDDQARGIFQGKVIVQPGAQKTDGKQMAQALMLSPEAEFDSKPELEIYADDVICGHGSTSAELDEDLLFYLRARGIPLIEARALLIESFIGEAIDKVAHEGVREALMAHARRWLSEGHLEKT